jgi:hypothetical protein
MLEKRAVCEPERSHPDQQLGRRNPGSADEGLGSQDHAKKRNMRRAGDHLDTIVRWIIGAMTRMRLCRLFIANTLSRRTEPNRTRGCSELSTFGNNDKSIIISEARWDFHGIGRPRACGLRSRGVAAQIEASSTMRGVIMKVLMLSTLSCSADGFSGVAPIALRKGGLSFSSANGAPNVRAPWAAPGLREHVGSLRCASTNSFDSVEKALVEARNLGDFTSTLEASRIVFVKLYQAKCRKCVALAPKFKSLAEQHASCGDVVFMKVCLTPLASPSGARRARASCTR